MKLIFCPHCQDVRKLDYKEVRCKCERSSGWYKSDGLNAIIAGSAIPVGFHNASFSRALHSRPVSGPGARFEAFVIPVECPTIERLQESNLSGL